MTHRILVAEDDELMRNYLVKVFKKVPWDVDIARDGREAIEKLTSRVYDVAVLDIWMPNYTGLEVLEQIKRRGVTADVVLLTGRGTIELAVNAMKAGARDFLTKPVESRDAVRIIGDILAQRRPSPNVLARQLDEFVRESASKVALRLGDICSQFAISERYACHLFKTELGTTFRRQLGKYRIEQAKELLHSTNFSMYRISELCGFRNQRRFAETFRREQGTTPRRYRDGVETD